VHTDFLGGDKGKRKSYIWPRGITKSKKGTKRDWGGVEKTVLSLERETYAHRMEGRDSRNGT